MMSFPYAPSWSRRKVSAVIQMTFICLAPSRRIQCSALVKIARHHNLTPPREFGWRKTRKR